MPPLPTVLLRHDAPDGVHYDWLLAQPDDPGGCLWTARTAQPSTAWQSMDRWPLEPLAAHRRIYLTYEGDLTGGRGRVTRVDEGAFTVIQWTEQRKVIDLHMTVCRGRVAIDAADGEWFAAWQTT